MCNKSIVSWNYHSPWAEVNDWLNVGWIWCELHSFGIYNSFIVGNDGVRAGSSAVDIIINSFEDLYYNFSLNSSSNINNHMMIFMMDPPRCPIILIISNVFKITQQRQISRRVLCFVLGVLLGFCFHRHKNICAAQHTTQRQHWPLITPYWTTDLDPTYTNHIDNTITVSKQWRGEIGVYYIILEVSEC